SIAADKPKVIDVQPRAPLRDRQPPPDAHAVAQVADNDVLARDSFFAEQVELLECELAKVCRVGQDRAARASMGACRGPKHALLGRADVTAFGADLANETGPNIGPIDTDR